jgi:hypothetical protein
MKRFAFLAAVACLFGCALPGTGWAGAVTYALHDSGAVTIFGNTVFNMGFTITVTGDTANVFQTAPGSFQIPGTATLNIGGSLTATFTDPVTAFDDQELGRVGFIASIPSANILDITNAAFTAYDLKSSIGPVFGSPGGETGVAIRTSLGDVELNDLNDPATFTATVATSIPEPGSLTLLSVAAAGLAGCGWRHRKRTA